MVLFIVGKVELKLREVRLSFCVLSHSPSDLLTTFISNCLGVAFTSKMVNPRPTMDNQFMFQKIYSELDYLAGGILMIPAGTEKPSKPAKDNSYVSPLWFLLSSFSIRLLMQFIDLNLRCSTLLKDLYLLLFIELDSLLARKQSSILCSSYSNLTLIYFLVS